MGNTQQMAQDLVRCC